ncbi:MAG: caspase family protein [Dokdonella sp.]|uniref:caspase family protein n=1 Tax=Dokdonella sp. TaxID=2291710 RepID=UPI0025BC68C1|nr:caspase family protein [Dokdonella sp.]MBZ0223001.1 caspase family protein [Dokdonella sp.]
MIKVLLLMTSALALLSSCATVAPGRLDSYDIVDCELPGVVLHIGSAHATTGRARAIRTSADDCGLRGGYYTEPDRANYETALRVWLPPAEDGDAQAQYNVAQIYEKGLGRPSDPQKAAQWYQRAADSGNAAAMTALAMLYERGLASGGDARIALDLYRRAAHLDQPLAYAKDLDVRDDQISTLREELAKANSQAQAQRDGAINRQRSLEAEVSRLRRELQRARSEANVQRTTQVEQSLQQAQQSLADQTTQSRQAELTAQTAQEVERLSRAPTPSADGNAPQIELLEPASTPVRGLVAVRVPDNTARQRIRVRVKSQLALKEVRIGKDVVSADGKGEFALDVPFGGRATPVEITAADVGNHQATLPLLLIGSDELPAARVTAAPEAPRRYFALVIGNAAYANWAALDTPHNDAESVAKLLRESYGFQTTLLLDATRAQTFRKLAELRKSLTENDDLLVYYSGHGSWDAGNHQGYWVPTDGDKDSVANYISSSDVTDQIGVMRARQILVVADSCYSGVFVHSVADESVNNSLDALLQRARIPSRKVMSSGNIREVLDGGRGNHSVFAAEFLDGLRRHASGPFEARQLYREIAPRVQAAADGYGEQQEPQYGQMRFAGHVGGDFLFVPRSGKDMVSVMPDLERVHGDGT